MKPLSREFLISRGKCCGCRCINCPYLEKWKTGCTLTNNKSEQEKIENTVRHKRGGPRSSEQI